MQEPWARAASTDGAVGALSHEQRAECWYKLGVMHAKKEGCGQREKNHHGSRRFLDMTRLLEQIKLKPCSALADQCEK